MSAISSVGSSSTAVIYQAALASKSAATAKSTASEEASESPAQEAAETAHGGVDVKG